MKALLVTSVKIPEKSGALVRRAELSDGSKFSFSLAYLPPEQGEMAPGRELDEAGAAALRRAAACYRTERAALQFLARAEQCRASLARKLERKGSAKDELAPVLDHLESSGILDDRRYAEAWLRSRLRAPGRQRGPRKLFAGLLGRGIAPKTARAALAGVLDAEGEAVLLRSFLRSRRGADLPDRDGSRRTLRAEGFSTAVIRAWEEENR